MRTFLVHNIMLKQESLMLIIKALNASLYQKVLQIYTDFNTKAIICVKKEIFTCYCNVFSIQLCVCFSVDYNYKMLNSYQIKIL